MNLKTNKIMKQTAVEWLYNNLKSHFEHDGDLLEVVQFSFEQAKEMEKQQQGYSLEDLKCAWDSSDQNMRFQFSSSAYKGITFKQWLEKYEHER